MAAKAPNFLALGVDPGRESGWAVATDPKTIAASGVAKTSSDRFDAIETAEAVARELGVPVVPTVERWTAGGWKQHSTILGLGEVRGRWLELIELILGVRKQDVVQPAPNTWRAALFEHSAWFGKSSAELKRLACTYTSCAQPDEAEARCLCMYTYHSIDGIEAADKAWRRLQRQGKR